MGIRGARHWSDWVGLAVFTGLAAHLWRQSVEVSLLVLPAVLQELLVALSFIVRLPARRRAANYVSRVVAYAHTFFVMAFLWYASAERPDWIRPTPEPALRLAGAAICLVAAMLSLWPIWALRHAFSVEPEARTLVTTGPYRWARHPVYTIYLLLNVGILLRHFTLPLSVALAAWAALLLARIRFEESVLLAAFPDYREYRRQVGAFGPRLGLRLATRTPR